MKKLTHSLLIFQLIFLLGKYKTKPEADGENRRERERERRENYGNWERPKRITKSKSNAQKGWQRHRERKHARARFGRAPNGRQHFRLPVAPCRARCVCVMWATHTRRQRWRRKPDRKWNGGKLKFFSLATCPTKQNPLTSFPVPLATAWGYGHHTPETSADEAVCQPLPHTHRQSRTHMQIKNALACLLLIRFHRLLSSPRPAYLPFLFVLSSLLHFTQKFFRQKIFLLRFVQAKTHSKRLSSCFASILYSIVFLFFERGACTQGTCTIVKANHNTNIWII